MRTACVKLPGHPDKTCDLVAEAIVDEYLRRDPTARLAVNVVGGHGALFVSGEVLSQADFDVTALVQRTLGSCGAAELEPFVSIEQVAAEQVAAAVAGATYCVAATGYATDETPELIPKTVQLARRLAKELEDKRLNEEEWFWLGPDAQVLVSAKASVPDTVEFALEHGAQALDEVRRKLEGFAQSIQPGIKTVTNLAGANEGRGLRKGLGRSGADGAAYGDALPRVSPGIGLDIRHPEKAGAWLARAAARKLVAQGARAALVRAVYEPGQTKPSLIQARDERGRDLSQALKPAQLDLAVVTQDWWRGGLSSDAARWGFAGQAGLPWEE